MYVVFDNIISTDEEEIFIIVIVIIIIRDHICHEQYKQRLCKMNYSVTCLRDSREMFASAYIICTEYHLKLSIWPLYKHCI